MTEASIIKQVQQIQDDFHKKYEIKVQKLTQLYEQFIQSLKEDYNQQLNQLENVYKNIYQTYNDQMCEIQNALSEYDQKRQKHALKLFNKKNNEYKNDEIVTEVTFRKQYTECSSIANAYERISKKSEVQNEDNKDINSSPKKQGLKNMNFKQQQSINSSKQSNKSSSQNQSFQDSKILESTLQSEKSMKQKLDQFKNDSKYQTSSVGLSNTSQKTLDSKNCEVKRKSSQTSLSDVQIVKIDLNVSPQKNNKPKNKNSYLKSIDKKCIEEKEEEIVINFQKSDLSNKNGFLKINEKKEKKKESYLNEYQEEIVIDKNKKERHSSCDTEIRKQLQDDLYEHDEKKISIFDDQNYSINQHSIIINDSINYEVDNNKQEKIDDLFYLKEFKELGLSQNIIKGLRDMQFDCPTLIQKKIIKQLVNQQNLIVQSKFGSGKTTAFCISILQNLDLNNFNLQAIIISPTRELSKQIEYNLSIIGKYLEFQNLGQKKGLEIQTFAGINNMKKEPQKLVEGVNIIIGTPFRIHQLLHKGILSKNLIKNIVIDEADSVLQGNQKQQVLDILKFSSGKQKPQICLFSEILQSQNLIEIKKYMNEPIRISEKPNLDDITQYFTTVDSEEEKFKVLQILCSRMQSKKTIVFCNNKRKLCELEKLIQYQQCENIQRQDDLFFAGQNTVVVYSDQQNQSQKELALREFRDGKIQILITNDLLNGIDLLKVSLVINYELSNDKWDYYKRVSKALKSNDDLDAIAISIIYGSNECKILSEFQEFFNFQIEEIDYQNDNVDISEADPEDETDRTEHKTDII